jgi:uncharacterized protein with NAD-binding domain and iron-sulfur cluster
MRQKVIVVGGGVAGLTAAHELIERDFEVHVIERRTRGGGKASSRRTAEGLPTEHGFRFFPGWYRHLPDTMRRIPFKGRRALYEGRSTYDNLITIRSNLLAWYDRDPIEAPMHLPRSFDQLRTMHSFFWGMMKLQLAPAEVSFFFTRLATFLGMPEDERRDKLSNVTWWQYLDADNKSRAFQDLISATTRSMVAAKATEASAYTICRLALRTLFDSVSGVDRILNGPTNEKWIDPWVEYLTGRGVHFHWGWEVRDIAFAQGGTLLQSIEYGYVLADSLRRLRGLLAPVGADLRKLLALAPADEGASPLRLTLRKRLEENAAAFVSLLGDLAETYELKRSPREDATENAVLLADLRAALKGCNDLIRVTRGILKLHDRAWQDGTFTKQQRSARKLIDSKDRRDPEEERAELVKGVVELEVKPSEYPERPTDEISPVDWLREHLESLRIAAAELSQPSADMAKWFSYGDWMFDESIMARIDDTLRYLERSIGKRSPPQAEANYFVFALPVEQMAYHVNRSTQATFFDPDLLKVVQLTSHLDWMAGIQFYLKEPIDLGHGHIVAMDSEWGLTAIEQTQFWDDLGNWPSQVKAVLSVDIAAWDRRGRFVNKEAFNCTDQEIAEEVWQELAAALGSDRGPQRLRKSMLVNDEQSPASADQAFVRGVNYMIDDSIVDLCDRRKQGAYERARSTRASSTADKPNPFNDAVPYIWGPRLRFNVEPLLVNRVGSHALRPGAKTKISNVFLASDYIRTETDLACMEGANEAARRAVNALLEVSGSRTKPCELWDFSLPSGLMDQLSSVARMGNAAELAGDAGKVAGKAADAAVDMATRAAGMLRGLWEKR